MKDDSVVPRRQLYGSVDSPPFTRGKGGNDLVANLLRLGGVRNIENRRMHCIEIGRATTSGRGFPGDKSRLHHAGAEAAVQKAKSCRRLLGYGSAGENRR